MHYISDIVHLSEVDQAVIRHRLKVLGFFDQYGNVATLEAFGVARSTVFLWKQHLKRGGGRLSSLRIGNRTPRQKRRRMVSLAVVSVIRQYRLDHPGVGKEVVAPVAQASAVALGERIPSESTVGRVIGDLKHRGELPKYRVTTTINGRTGKLKVRQQQKGKPKLRVPKGVWPTTPGERIQIDAIVIFIQGLKRYVLTAIDVPTRFAFAYAYTTLSSTTSRDFLHKLEAVAPFPILSIQTDNGAEFHKYFAEYAVNRNWPHYYTYPHSPKMNAYVERFNRTIQEQHIGWRLTDLMETRHFNHGLMDYLVWYNTEKPHRGIGRQTPLRYYLNTFTKPRQSNMLWTLTDR